MTSKPIIVGTDGSGDSLRAVEWAAREAALRRVPLQVVCVPALPPRMSWHQPPGRPDAVAEVGYESYACALAAASERACELEPELAIETGLLSGPAAPTLAETTVDASMLVVGSRGAGLFPALVLGSASRYAATHGRCPVVVERQGLAYGQGEIVVGVGDLDQSDAALGFASRKRICVGPGWSSCTPGHASCLPRSRGATRPTRSGSGPCTILATTSTLGWPCDWKTCSSAGGRSIQPSKPRRKSCTRIPVTCWPRPPSTLTSSCSAASPARGVGQLRARSFMPCCTTRAARWRS